MREKAADVIEDIRAGKVVSPRRIKNLIRTRRHVLAGFEWFVENGGEHAAEARKEAGEIRREIERYMRILARASDIAEALHSVPVEFPGDGRKEIRDMMREWDAEAAGCSLYGRYTEPGALSVPGVSMEVSA